MQGHPPQQTWISYAITGAIIVVVMALRMRKMGQMRPLKLENLWIVPALYAAVAGWMFWQLPPFGWVGLACLVAFAIGAAVGWQRGKMMEIHIDSETHALNQKASIAGMLFIVGLIVVKTAAQIEESQIHMNVVLLTQAFGAFGLGLFTMTRVEMYLRAKRMLEQAGAA